MHKDDPLAMVAVGFLVLLCLAMTVGSILCGTYGAITLLLDLVTR